MQQNLKQALAIVILMFPAWATAQPHANAALDATLQEVRNICAELQRSMARFHEVSVTAEKLRVERERNTALRYAVDNLERDVLQSDAILRQNEVDLKVLQQKVLEDPSSEGLLKALYESIEVHRHHGQQQKQRLSTLKGELSISDGRIHSVLATMEAAAARIAPTR